jgi:hypothetical protein
MNRWPTWIMHQSAVAIHLDGFSDGLAAAPQVLMNLHGGSKRPHSREALIPVIFCAEI